MVMNSREQQRTACQTGPLAFFGGSMEIYQEKVTQELRLSSNFDGNISFMLGAFYSVEEVKSEFNVGISGVIQGLPGLLVLVSAYDPQYTQDTTSYSLFGQLIWNVSDTVELSAGLRWTKEEKGFSASEAGIDITNSVDSDDFTNTSPELTLAWPPTENATYFVSYKEGFKSGGFNTSLVSGGYAAQAPNIIDTSFGQDTVEGFEGGAKWALNDGTLQQNAAIYHYEYKGMQLSSFDGETISILVPNAGKSTVQGFEMDLTFSTSWDLEYSSDYYTHTALGPNSIQDSYIRLNASFTLSHQKGWEASVIGRNLTEEYVMTTGTDLLFTGNAALGIPADYLAASYPETIVTECPGVSIPGYFGTSNTPPYLDI